MNTRELIKHYEDIISDLRGDLGETENYRCTGGMTPHKCPVCMGTGQVTHNFYAGACSGGTSAPLTPVTCRSCGGSGIIWG